MKEEEVRGVCRAEQAARSLLRLTVATSGLGNEIRASVMKWMAEHISSARAGVGFVP